MECLVSPLFLGCFYTLFHLHSSAWEPRDQARNRREFVGKERDPEKASLSWHNIALLPFTTTSGAQGRELALAVSPLSVFCYCLASSRKRFSSQYQGDEKEKLRLFCSIRLNRSPGRTPAPCHPYNSSRFCSVPPWIILWAVLLGHTIFRKKSTSDRVANLDHGVQETWVSIPHQALWEQISGQLKK